MKRLIALALLFTTSPILFAKDCGDWARANSRQSRLVVELDGRIAKPMFYARSQQFVMFFDPSQAIETLNAIVAKSRSESDKSLLVEIQKELPLKRDTDLFQSAVENPVLFLRTQYLIADLLQSGKAALFNLFYTGSNAIETKIVVVENAGGRSSPVSREFCT